MDCGQTSGSAGTVTCYIHREIVYKMIPVIFSCQDVVSVSFSKENVQPPSAIHHLCLYSGVHMREWGLTAPGPPVSKYSACATPHGAFITSATHKLTENIKLL